VTGLTVDVHAHAVPAELIGDLAAGRVRFPHIAVERSGHGHALSFCGGPPTRPVAAGLTDAALRDAWLTKQRIDRQVVGGWLDIFGYELPAGEGADWALALTEGIAALAAQDPRLTPLGTVPLQDPQRAAAAITDMTRRPGLPGVMIATRAGDRELDDPALTPFWEAADAAGALVYVHPGFAGSARYSDFGLVNGLARVEDGTVTLARLLYAGVPARYPRARIVAAHGGGALPYVLGRLARNHAINAGSTADPVESFARLYFDSVVFDPAVLAFLVAKAGQDRVLLGSDYPFPIGDLAPREVVERAALRDGARAGILGGNAARLLLEASAGTP
jgi:aminocarboxymuconate-semialdehyde decarboxylase